VRVLPILLASLVFVAGCGGGSDEASSGDTNATTTSAFTECADVDAPDARTPEPAKAPSEPLDPAKTYTLTFATSCGSFTVTLDQKLAPKTAASLVALANDGYFDDTIFHRVVSGFVIQGGDPTQSGSGGPGYSTVDVPPSDAKYTKGVVAMAKSQVEAPGTSGSQFFVVTGDDIGLPPDYAIVGKVTSGLPTVDRIGELGDPATEQPTQPVVIDKVSVVEQP
jgi:peptidyl-prolyl cis-trans isomerase B (cyclophilin B)